MPAHPTPHRLPSPRRPVATGLLLGLATAIAIGTAGAGTALRGSVGVEVSGRLRGDRPTDPDAVFIVELFVRTDDLVEGVTAADVEVAWSADLEPVDDDLSLIASESTRPADIFLDDAFATFASIERDEANRTLALFGGTDLPAGGRGEGQRDVGPVRLARLAFRNAEGGGFTLRIAGRTGVAGTIAFGTDWLGRRGPGPEGSATFVVAGGGDGLD